MYDVTQDQLEGLLAKWASAKERLTEAKTAADKAAQARDYHIQNAPEYFESIEHFYAWRERLDELQSRAREAKQHYESCEADVRLRAEKLADALPEYFIRIGRRAYRHEPGVYPLVITKEIYDDEKLEADTRVPPGW